MGCSCSSNTAVQPLTEANRVQDEAGSKCSGRGDSAGSKRTADSGVVLENRDLLMLPGAVPEKLPPLSSESLKESEAERKALNVFTLGAEPGLLQGDAPVKGRPKSSEILEELWNQGIIPVGESWGKDSGPAFCIMDEPKGAARRPPARLKSLKARKDQSHSKEDLDEKMRLVEERRKFKQDELKTRLRTSSARGRRSDPTFTTEEDTDPTLSPVESLHLPPISEPSPASPLHSQMAHKAAMGGQWVKEAAGDNGGFREGENASQEAEEKGDCQEGRAEEGEMEEEEVTQVEELRRSELLAALEELESDSSFQHAEHKDETF